MLDPAAIEAIKNLVVSACRFRSSGKWHCVVEGFGEEIVGPPRNTSQEAAEDSRLLYRVLHAFIKSIGAEVVEHIMDDERTN